MNVKRWRAEVRAVRRASLRFAHHGLSAIGLIAVVAACWMFVRPEYAQTVGRWFHPGESASPLFAMPIAKIDPFAGAIADPTGEASRMLGLAPVLVDGVAESPVLTGAGGDVARSRHTIKERRDLVKYLSRKYRINNDALAMLVDAAYVTGKDLGMDPVLLLSVMAIESGFNPFAESTAGASGLMQLMSKVHSDKLSDYGGANIALNPVANLRVGAVVLKDCIERGGSVADGLRLYVGAGNGPDNGYGLRVLQEKDRMLQAARGIVVQPRIRPAAPVAKPSAEAADDKPVADKTKADEDRVAVL